MRFRLNELICAKGDGGGSGGGGVGGNTGAEGPGFGGHGATAGAVGAGGIGGNTGAEGPGFGGPGVSGGAPSGPSGTSGGGGGGGIVSSLSGFISDAVSQARSNYDSMEESLGPVGMAASSTIFGPAFGLAAPVSGFLGAVSNASGAAGRENAPDNPDDAMGVGQKNTVAMTSQPQPQKNMQTPTIAEPGQHERPGILQMNWQRGNKYV